DGAAPGVLLGRGRLRPRGADPRPLGRAPRPAPRGAALARRRGMDRGGQGRLHPRLAPRRARRRRRQGHGLDPLPQQGVQVKLQPGEIRKPYGGRGVVRGISLEVSWGEIGGLLGPNGGGKTTTFYSLAGFVQPESGETLIDGEDVPRLPMYA